MPALKKPDATSLTADELALCKRIGVTPEEFAAAKAIMDAAAKASESTTEAPPSEQATNAEGRRLGLTPEELAMCHRTGVTPSAYARAKAA